jgi:gluconate 2-dehydrogenase alpha chain
MPVREHEPVDIVTIGGGLTAAIFAARTLAGTSHRMVSLEQGPAQWTYPDFAHNHDSLRYANRFAMMHDAALAYRTADAIRDRYFADPGGLLS